MLHFLGADLIRLSHVRGDWWIRGKREWINFKCFFKKKRVRPTFAQITVLISISSLKGDTCRGWQVVWREMNEIRGKEVSYTTRHAHLYTCGSWTGCESIPVSQRLLQHVEILWLSKCVVVETVPALTNVGHVTQQQCHSCAWVVIFTRPIIGSQTKIKILAGQCSTQFELDGMGKRKQVLLLCWISVGKTQNQEGANNHHVCL